MMSACASLCINCRAVTNFSNSSSDTDPNSLHGARCKASSITPSVTVHDKALSLIAHGFFDSAIPSCTLVSFVASRISLELNCLPHPIHLFNLIFHPRRNHVALQLSVHRQHSAFNRERFLAHHEAAHLLIMRELRIHDIQRRLHFFSRHASRHDGRQVSSAVPHNNNLLRLRQTLRNRTLDRLRRNLVPRSQNNQILDSPRNPPVARSVHFALIARVKPSLAQRVGSLLWTFPVAGKHIRPSHHDL